MAMTDTCVCLPLEIVYHIIDSLQGDPLTLCRCALAHRNFLPCVRTNLYGRIELTGRDVFRRTQLLCDTLKGDPDLCLLVRSLLVTHATGTAHTADYLAPRSLPFNSLSRLRELTLYWTQLEDCVEDLLSIISVLPQLTRLVCQYILVHHPWPGIAPVSRPAVLAPGGRRPAEFPRLRELVVKHGGWNHSLFAEQLFDNHRAAIENLRVIDVAYGHTAQALAWVPIIRTAGAQVQSLSIVVADRSARLRDPDFPVSVSITHACNRYANDHAYVLDNVAHCTALRHLCLKYYPDAHVHEGDPLEFLEALCEVLERRHLPFPDLEHLELWMVDRDGRMVAITEENCARLARTLLARERYPRFRRLTVRVQPHAWRADSVLGPTWYVPTERGEQLHARRAATVPRWRAAFAAFERVPGVELDVDLLHRDTN